MSDRTTDELRDRLAELKGWTNSGGRWYYPPHADEDGTPYREVHPFPAGDLTALVAALSVPKWRWFVEYDYGSYSVEADRIWPDNDHPLRYGPCPDLYDALLPLAVAVLEERESERSSPC